MFNMKLIEKIKLTENTGLDISVANYLNFPIPE